VPYELPNKLPNELVVSGKTYTLLAAKKSVERGVCKSNDGSWFYYFNRQVVDGSTVNIGSRRHFSVRKATGQRAVHISLKPHGATLAKPEKRDDIQIWYSYDACWNGQRRVPSGWGRTPSGVRDRDRLDKAFDLLEAFLEAMHAVATAPSAPVVQPNPRPPVAMIPAAVAPPQAPPPPVVVLPTVDDWESLPDD
jgi:hypothetical protein